MQTKQMPIQSALKKTSKLIANSSNNDSLLDVMKRLNEITELLVKQQASSQLPKREFFFFMKLGLKSLISS
jgi:hypothetical protein